jgi:hypothetical protein
MLMRWTIVLGTVYSPPYLKAEIKVELPIEAARERLGGKFSLIGIDPALFAHVQNRKDSVFGDFCFIYTNFEVRICI